ncbi:NUDIX hydrolase [Alteromonas sp. KUL49]|uniref:NUDIX domain-containing protein n=1 Tax=Alteromonas sp. KUL49 TaxID=2480798 RepID=UPI00102EF538|nr:NUDIX hydrolase [Alteromonas sp. KUL49]TAP40342.1 NUDIX hydrolase [Alteromonas sp. KUL49]GEA11491.1 ADP-ribose pyrophosphatase [Alteromonas sp. KUL49]
MSNKEIETLSSEVKYQNKWMTLREDVIRRQSGQEGIYGVVDKPDFAIILPIDGDDVYLVEQYRYTIGERQLEFPQGAWESNPDADPKVLAGGELKEETGLDASELIYVGFQYLAYGFCSQGYHIFVAKGLTQGEQSLDPEEEGLTLHKLSLTEVEQKIRNGEIKDASTCNALGLAKLNGII